MDIRISGRPVVAFQAPSLDSESPRRAGRGLANDRVVPHERTRRGSGREVAADSAPDANVGGPDLWFGRYTGATLGGARMPEEGRHKRLDDVAREMRSMCDELDQLVGADEELTAQISDPRATEMLRAGTWLLRRPTSSSPTTPC